METLFPNLNKMEKNMKAKKSLVSLFVITSILLSLVSVNVAAVLPEVEVDGVNAEYASVVAGETVPIVIWFTAGYDDTQVTVKAEIEGDKIDVDTETAPFDVEAGKTYRKVLSLKVPYELQDDPSEDVTLNIEIDGRGYSFSESYTLRVQRPSYNVGFMSIGVSSLVEAGEIFPVEVVLKNTGYNDLDDLYVTVEISALDVQKTAYFGDLVAIENETDDDEEDTVSGRLYLQVPYDAKTGVYTLETTVENGDLTLTKVNQISVKNDFYNNIIVTDYRKSVAINGEAQYELLIVNPTNSLKVYRLVPESTNAVTSKVDEAVVAVPAGTSKTVNVAAKANSEGEHSFKVDMFSGEELVNSVTLTVNADKGVIVNPIVVLTIVLAIVFLVLLSVLIVLITKKPKKEEEYGESYY